MKISKDDLNPYSPTHESKKHNVAALLLSGDTVSYDDLRLVAGGHLSPRTFGRILRDLEGQQLSFLRIRDPSLGSLYRFDPLVPFDERFRLGKTDGPDALRGVEKHDDDDGDEPEGESESSEEEALPHPRTLVEVLSEFPIDTEEEAAMRRAPDHDEHGRFTIESAEGVDVDILFFHEDDGDVLYRPKDDGDLPPAR